MRGVVGAGGRLARRLQEVHIENLFEQKLDGEEKASLSSWKSIPSRGNGKCRGPELQVCLKC